MVFSGKHEDGGTGMTLGLRNGFTAVGLGLCAMLAVSGQGMAQQTAPKIAPARPMAVTPSSPSLTPGMAPSPSLVLPPPPVLHSRPGGCPEGPPCPPATVAPDAPAVRPGGCPEGDPCPERK